MHPALENLDDDHAAATAWAGWTSVLRFGWCCCLRRRRHRQKFSGTREICVAPATGEQSVMADAVEALWQDVQEKASDELADGERHGPLSVRPVAAVIFIAKGYARLV